MLPGFLRHALRSNRPDLPVTDANGQYIAGGGAAGGVLRYSQATWHRRSILNCLCKPPQSRRKGSSGRTDPKSSCAAMTLGSRTAIPVAAAAAVSDGCLSLIHLLTPETWFAYGWSSTSSSTSQLDSSKLCLAGHMCTRATTAHRKMCTSAVDGSVCIVVQVHSHMRPRTQARQVSQLTTSEEQQYTWWTRQAYAAGAVRG